MFGPPTQANPLGNALAVGDVVGDANQDLIVADSGVANDTGGVDVLTGLGDTTITAALDAGSDSGVSNSDDVTNVTTPTFRGTGPAGLSLILVAVRDGDLRRVFAQGGIDATGHFTVTFSTPIPDGSYAVDAGLIVNNFVVSGQPVALNNASNRLIVDTDGPRVVSTSLDTSAKTVRIVFSDATGLVPASLSNLSDYQVALLTGRRRTPFKITGVEVAPGAAGQVVAIVHFTSGKTRLSSKSMVQITAHAAGISDVAGNKLDGVFNGRNFPSGNGLNGSDFVQTFNAPPPKKKKPGGGKP
jgi:hypothetical protein